MLDAVPGEPAGQVPHVAAGVRELGGDDVGDGRDLPVHGLDAVVVLTGFLGRRRCRPARTGCGSRDARSRDARSPGARRPISRKQVAGEPPAVQQPQRADRADRSRRGDAPAPGGSGRVVTERKPGGESAAEAVARAGRIDHLGGRGGYPCRAGAGPGHQRAAATQLDHHAPHPGADQLGSRMRRIVVPDDLAELLARRHEDVGQPRDLEHVATPPPVLVRVQRDDRLADPAPDRPDQGRRGRQRHGGDVHHRRRRPLQPPGRDVLRPRCHLGAAAARRPVDPGPGAVGLVNDPVPDGRPFDGPDAGGVGAGLAQPGQRRGGEVGPAPGHHADLAGPGQRGRGGVHRVAAERAHLAAAVGLDDVVDGQVADDDHRPDRHWLLLSHSGGISL